MDQYVINSGWRKRWFFIGIEFSCLSNEPIKPFTKRYVNTKTVLISRGAAHIEFEEHITLDEYLFLKLAGKTRVS